MKITYKGILDRDYFSRYLKDRVINDTEHLYYEYDSYIDLSNFRYVEHIITSSEVNRLTIIAQKYYNNPLYWWMIAQMNGLTNPFETPAVGSTIKIPYRDDIVRLYNKIVVDR